jgi:D-serine deaminase-like pyridoxal phosphate-dependent protein
MVKNEGFGEVQTPVVVPKNLQVKPGDPLFFRPAKAGEIAERFNEYILLRDNKIVDKVPTYRGLGQCFY